MIEQQQDKLEQEQTCSGDNADSSTSSNPQNKRSCYSLFQEKRYLYVNYDPRYF